MIFLLTNAHSILVFFRDIVQYFSFCKVCRNYRKKLMMLFKRSERLFRRVVNITTGGVNILIFIYTDTQKKINNKNDYKKVRA